MSSDTFPGEHLGHDIGPGNPSSMFTLDLERGVDGLRDAGALGDTDLLDWTTVTVHGDDHVAPHDQTTPAPPPPPMPPTPHTPAAPVSAPVSASGPTQAPMAATAATGASQPPASAPAGSNERRVEMLANDVLIALFQYEEASAVAGPETAEAASQLLAEIDRLRVTSPASMEELKAARWDDVAATRTAYRRLLDGGNGPSITVSSDQLAKAGQLQSVFEDAEHKARRPMSGPGAFKKFAVARKELALHLGQFGVETYSELLELAEASDRATPGTLHDAAEAVAAAEAAWMDAAQPASDGIPDSPAMDGLRVRAYRLIGAIVDDVELIIRLQAAADSGVVLEQHLIRLTRALQALGLPADTDPLASARAIRLELNRQ